MARVLPITPAAVPTVEEIEAEPSRASSLPPATLHALLCRCATVQTVLLGALMASGTSRAPETPDNLLDIEVAAGRLGCSKDWLYHHARQLPFTVRNGRLLRFSSHGIDRYIKSRQGR
jgi:predicted DNA-binding transcriptional regulator AlpA